MKKRDWSTRVVIRYSLLQIPGLALLIFILIVARRWIELPVWLIWGIVIIWVIKDMILFPFVWRAYDWDRPKDSNSMVGLRGVVQEPLSPLGSVRVRGELWQAEVIGDGPPIQAGEYIQVREIRGLTLYVESNRKESGSIEK